MELVAIHQNAKKWIAELTNFYDVKDFRDKAASIETYAKLANDYDLERDAAIARVRAERKCGELLKEAVQHGGNRKSRSADSTLKSKTLSEIGITKDQSSNWQKLAGVPEEKFEEAISIPGMSVSGRQVLATVNPIPREETVRMDSSVLWWWGTLRDMEQDNRFDRPLVELMAEMTDGMIPDAERIIPKLITWIKDYEKSRHTSNAA